MKKYSNKQKKYMKRKSFKRNSFRRRSLKRKSFKKRSLRRKSLRGGAKYSNRNWMLQAPWRSENKRSEQKRDSRLDRKQFFIDNSIDIEYLNLTKSMSDHELIDIVTRALARDISLKDNELARVVPGYLSSFSSSPSHFSEMPMQASQNVAGGEQLPLELTDSDLSITSSSSLFHTLRTGPTFFLLIPGANNKWGKGRDPPLEGQGPALWQSIIQEEIEKSPYSHFFSDISERYQDYKPHENPPQWNNAGMPYDGEEAFNILRNICRGASNDPTIPNNSISIISTSQGSSLTFALLDMYPEFRNKIKNIVFCSPAFIVRRRDESKVCGVEGRRIKQTIQGIPTLFIETQHGFARHDTPGDPWGNFVREYFDTHHNQPHFKIMIPTTQHSGDMSKKSGLGGCKSLIATNFCDHDKNRYLRCRDVLSDSDLMYNQSIQDNIWKLVHQWCEKNDHSIIPLIKEQIYNMKTNNN